MPSLSQDESLLIPLPSVADWNTYGNILQSTEQALVRLFDETDKTLALVEAAESGAFSTLDAAESTLTDLQSRTASAKDRLDNFSNLPVTGGTYTHFIMDAFQSNQVRDTTVSLGSEPLVYGSTQASVYACPSRPSLEMDARKQVLRLKNEGTLSVISGLPGTSGITVDRAHGNASMAPASMSKNVWKHTVVSHVPLLETDAVPSWIPSTYTGGACVRLKVQVENPSPATEVHLRGLSSTTLLETVIAVDSRLNPLMLTGHPAKALNAPWQGNFTGSGLTITGQARWAVAPDRSQSAGGSTPDQAIIIHGLASLSVPVTALHYILRYRAYCPYLNPYDAQALPAGNPCPPKRTYVQAVYTQSGAVLGTEYFKDEYTTASVYTGVSSFVHLLSCPAGTDTVTFQFGTDPGLDFHKETANAEVAYSDFWVCDETITRLWNLALPDPISSSTAGLISTDADLQVSLGNPKALLPISTAWITLSQPSARLLPADVPAPETAPTNASENMQEYEFASKNAPLSALPFGGIDPLPLRWTPAPARTPEHKSFGWFGKLRSNTLPAYARLDKSRARTLPVPALFTNYREKEQAAVYTYTIGLSGLSLIRQQYASSGLYLSRPIQNIGGGISAEIREIGIATDPPLATFGDRIRLWVVPDSEVLEGTQQDSPSSLLARAVPLDRARPRATFHCSSESLPAVIPAFSDISEYWKNLTKKNLTQPLPQPLVPAFSIPPSQASESMQGLLAFQNSFQLKRVPYINREAITRIATVLTTGSALLPGTYDPNAVKPLASLATGGTYAVGGYRPVTLELKLSNGATVFPDALGRPRPGEIIYSGSEILQEGADISAAKLPSSPDPYTYSTSNNLANAERAQITFSRSFTTAHSPIASGAQGAAISLWWHKSADFDASKGGVQFGYDVLLSASEYDVDALSGSIRVRANPPGSWADYDQIVAKYYWRSGTLAPREVFPQRDLTALYTPFNPYLVSAPSGISTTQPPSIPSIPLLQGYKSTATLLSDPAMLNHGQSWQAFGKNSSGDGLWNGYGHFTYDPKLNLPFACFAADDSSEGVSQSFPYPGPGTANLSTWYSYNTGYSNDVPTDRRFSFKLEVVNSNGTVEEMFEFQFRPVQAGTPGLPCLAGSQTDSSNLPLNVPPGWFPSLGVDGYRWLLFRSSLSQGTQVVYQWPSAKMSQVTLDNGKTGFAVATSPDGIPGTAIDNTNTFAVNSTDRPEAPYATQVPFVSLKQPGRTLKVTTRALDGNNDGKGVAGFRTDVWWTTPSYRQGCPAGYTYDAASDTCTLTASLVNPLPTSGLGAGGLKAVPSSLADLLAASLQQSYPVTRNVTDYEQGTVSPLTPVDMDPLSPSYYPVFEYRIDSGGIPVLANDFSDIGPYAGTELVWKYDYLDNSPRIILEILPEGLTSLSLPSTIDPGSTSESTPEIAAIYMLINARS